MQSEGARIASFKTVKKYSRRSSIQGSREWPHPVTGAYLAYPESLAEAGFYHDPYALYPVRGLMSTWDSGKWGLSAIRITLPVSYAKKSTQNGNRETILMKYI